MRNLFSEIIDIRPIFVDGIITLYGTPPQPQPQPQPQPAPKQQLTNELATELRGLGSFQVILKTSGVPLSALARRIYGLDKNLEDFAREDE